MAAWLATARVDEAALVGLRDNLARFRRADEAFTLRAALLPQMISHFSTAPAGTAGLLGAQVSLAADVHARMELGERLQFEEQLLAAHSARPRAPAIPYLLRFLYEQRSCFILYSFDSNSIEISGSRLLRGCKET